VSHCCFLSKSRAPASAPADKIWPLRAIDEAIRLRDKALLVLSEGAIASDWVEGEVTRVLDEERTRKNVVLFSVRLDNAVMQTSAA
jgi:hypothetical protein